MAGDWLKIEKATARKPEVLRLAELLSIHPDHAFGICFRFWSWCDDHLTNGNAASVTRITIDNAVDRPGFADALVSVGWLRDRNSSLEVPNFDRHISQSAKSRALTAGRVADHKRRKGNAPSVSDALPIEEKRIEEKNKTKTEDPPNPPQSRGDSPPSDLADGSADLPEQAKAWNANASLPAVRSMSADRKRHLRARLADPWWREHWREGIAAVAGSAFCRGENDRGWVATFDWFVKPGTLVKVLEGKYAGQPRAGPQSQAASDKQAKMDRARKIAFGGGQ